MDRPVANQNTLPGKRNANSESVIEKRKAATSATRRLGCLHSFELICFTRARGRPSCQAQPSANAWEALFNKLALTTRVASFAPTDPWNANERPAAALHSGSSLHSFIPGSRFHPSNVWTSQQGSDVVLGRIARAFSLNYIDRSWSIALHHAHRQEVSLTLRW